MQNVVNASKSEDDEEEEEEEEEEELELSEPEESEQEKEEEEEEEQVPARRRSPPRRPSPERRRRPAPLRMNIATKVQRLRADPNFSSIRPETLGRVVQQFEHDPNTPSVIINTTVSKAVARRKAVRWTAAEVEYQEVFIMCD